MELQFCLSSLTMAVSLHTYSTYPYSALRLHHEDIKFNHKFKFKSFSCSSLSKNKTQIHTTKAKTRQRPSFFEQIRDKWSLKLTSTRQKLPWQQQEEQEQNHQPEEEEIVSPQTAISNSEDGKTSASNFQQQNRLIYAPWAHGIKQSKPKSYSLNKDENVVDVKSLDCIVGGTDDKGISFEKKFSTENRIDEEIVKLGSMPMDSMKICKNLVEKPISGSEEVRNKEGINESTGISIELPWEGGEVSDSLEGGGRKKKSNTKFAEKMLPEHELKRLRNVSLRMLERIKVGAAGITQDLVDKVHEKWKLDEVVKLKFEEPLLRNMKRTHEMLESRTGGLVIWRSGSSVVLFRGMNYKLHCVQSYAKHSEANLSLLEQKEDLINTASNNIGIEDSRRAKESFVPSAAKYLKDLSREELMDYYELNQLLGELGPRFIDWCGREPLPVDADLLPGVVPGYQTPYRLLPYGVRRGLTDKEMTTFRRTARTMPPHFALGRNRDLQGLAKAMVKLWESSAIAKIAIKRGVPTTSNDRMAEELKRLTGGTLLSRNKEYIVFYRGNDFLPPVLTETLKERNKLTYLEQDEEELARKRASALVESKAKVTKSAFIAGTLTETLAATSRWQNQVSSEDVEKMMRDSALSRHTSLVKHLEAKLAMAKGKLKKADKALAKIQEKLEPREFPTDLETLTDEERFLFRKIGLSMKPYLPLGRRDVYDGIIQNMHLHWKYREVVKIIVRGKNFAQVKHIAISLEAESGGILVSVDKSTKGYAIILYRGKNYQRPREMKPTNLLTKRQALARSIELQRREALKHHILDLQERIELIKSELEEK